MYAECTGISTFSARPVRPGTRHTRKTTLATPVYRGRDDNALPRRNPPPPKKKKRGGGKGGVLLSQRISEARFSIFTAPPSRHPESAEEGGVLYVTYGFDSARSPYDTRTEIQTNTVRHTDRRTDQHRAPPCDTVRYRKTPHGTVDTAKDSMNTARRRNAVRTGALFSHGI